MPIVEEKDDLVESKLANKSIYMQKRKIVELLKSNVIAWLEKKRLLCRLRMFWRELKSKARKRGQAVKMARKETRGKQLPGNNLSGIA